MRTDIRIAVIVDKEVTAFFGIQMVELVRSEMCSLAAGFCGRGGVRRKRKLLNSLLFYSGRTNMESCWGGRAEKRRLG